MILAETTQSSGRRANIFHITRDTAFVETNGLSADGREDTITDVMWHRIRIDALESACKLGQSLAALLGADAVNDQQRRVTHQTVTSVRRLSTAASTGL
jgi:hypothetical protein